jgi:hypothetical protein
VIEAWHWLVLGLVLIGAETVLPGVFLVWFGLAAVVTAGVALLIASLAGEVAVFAVGSIAAVLAGRAWQRRQGKPAQGLNQRGEQLIGRTVTLSTATVNGIASAPVDDGSWRVKSLTGEIAAGTTCVVRGVEGATLLIDPHVP